MHALDAIDRKILSLLQSDSRTTMQELADKVGLLKNKLTRLDGIASIESSFALSQVKYSIALPV